MKLVVFGLAVSSAWGNGHATLWRGLIRALSHQGHSVTFYERDTPYYAAHRDCHELPGGELILYPDFGAVRRRASLSLRDADVAIVTSYCPDALEAAELAFDSQVQTRVFYDLDTPITLARLARGEPVPYIGPRGLRDYDLVLSFTGGPALSALRDVLGAQRVAALYGSVDPEAHFPARAIEAFRADLAYLGTYAAERQAALAELFLAPAAALPEALFAIGGSQYPHDFPWASNIKYLRHVTPQQHAAFYSSSRLHLNVTRAPMAEMGFCPSGRLFEAAACGAALISDDWPGLSQFYTPDREILLASTRDDVVRALQRDDDALRAMARRARERTLAEHTTARRAAEMLRFLDLARRGEPDVRPDPVDSLEVKSCGV